MRRIVRLYPPRPVTELAIGTRHQHGAHAVGGVVGQYPAGADGLVVGMGVYRHEGEGSIIHWSFSVWETHWGAVQLPASAIDPQEPGRSAVEVRAGPTAGAAAEVGQPGP